MAVGFLCVLCGGASLGLGAQVAARQGRGEGAPEAAPKATQAGAPSTETFSYRPEGRRDPFLSLINRVADNRATAKRPEGVRGLSFNDIVLRGILQGGKPTAIAIVQAPDNKSYRLHVGDQLFDAVVKAITNDSLVVMQEVNDPLSLQKQAERRKTLRVVEEVK